MEKFSLAGNTFPEDFRFFHMLSVFSRSCAAIVSRSQVRLRCAAVFISCASLMAQPPANLIKSGADLFAQKCSFCHGRDAGGGETGPDLTRSSLVTADMDGDKIGPIVRNGRPETGMPAFNISPAEIRQLAAFIHNAKAKMESKPGDRRGVDDSDLQTGNAEKGKKYFYGPGGCASCHSPTGDLAGVARRYHALQLERQMLYPQKAKATATVVTPSGQTVTGILAYKDEFTIALEDSNGWYRSWSPNQVKYTINTPAEAHSNLLTKYTDEDIHDLMAYLQTLR